MRDINFNFNGMIFKVNAESWIIEELLREYSRLKSQDKADIEIHFKEKVDFEDGNYYTASKICFISDEYLGFEFPNNFILKIDPANKKVYAKLPDYFYKNPPLKNLLMKWYDTSFLDIREWVVRFIFEDIIVPLMVLFGERSSPIHASSFSIEDHAYLITGAGGVGKTGTLVKLSMAKRINFYSDDWAFINEDKISLNPTWPKIYAYNLEDDNELKKIIFKDRNILDKLQWYGRRRLFGIKGVRRRINPNLLFNIQNKPLKMGTVLYFVITNEASFSCERIDSKILAEDTVKILEFEYSSLFNYYSLLESLKDSTDLEIKSKDEILSNIKINYTNFFNNLDNYKIYIPIKTKPIDLIEYLKQQKILGGI